MIKLEMGGIFMLKKVIATILLLALLTVDIGTSNGTRREAKDNLPGLKHW